MKKIIAYIPTAGQHTTMKRLATEIADSFTMLGQDVFKVDLENQEDTQRAYDLMLQDDVYFTIGLNASPSKILMEDGTSIYKKIDIPYVSIMLDAPYNTAVGNIGFECNKHILCLLDRSHINLLESLFPNKSFAGAVFLPLAGISAEDESKVFDCDRPYDVIFSASMYPGGDPGYIWRNNYALKPFWNILDDVADYLMSVPKSVSDGFEYVLRHRGIYSDDIIKAMLPMYYHMFFYIKINRRIKSLELLAKNDIPVDVFGIGWDDIPLINGPHGNNIRLHGPVPYDEMIDIISKTKIVYQDQAEFNNGAHDRVFTAMLNGAVVVSEYSSYLEEEFEDGRDICFFDWKNGIRQVSVIDDLLSDESKRLAMSINAYGKVNLKHRWINRAERIIEVIELYKLAGKL